MPHPLSPAGRRHNLCLEISEAGMALRESALSVAERMSASCARLSDSEAAELNGPLYKLLDLNKGKTLRYAA